MSPRNPCGLTFDEWCDAAGPGCPEDRGAARRAWALGEDPSDHRADAERAAGGLATSWESASGGPEKGEILWAILLTVGGAALLLAAFWLAR